MRKEQIKEYFDYDYKDWREKKYAPNVTIPHLTPSGPANPISFNSASTCSPVYSGQQLSFSGFSYSRAFIMHENLKIYLKDNGYKYSLKDLQTVLEQEKDEKLKLVIQDYIKPRLMELWAE